MDIFPLLSICIPTYNRSDILEFVLKQYTNNPEFDYDVEIVISDNCSSDNTQKICLYYSSNYKNIKYFRNEENIKDKNFIKVLERANGAYLKLVNDWAYYDCDSLKYVKNVIRENMGNNIPIFFTNDCIYTKNKSEIVRCRNLDEYVKTVSTFVTSNNIFGVWKDHWAFVEEKSKYSSLMLQQVDWTFQIVSRFNGCILFDKECLMLSPIKRRILGGYNWFQIHMDNYYKIMEPYMEKGFISNITLKEDKHNLLEHFKPEFCYTYFFNYTSFWRFDTSGTTSLLLKYYKGDIYLLYFFLKLPLFYVSMIINSIKRRIL